MNTNLKLLLILDGWGYRAETAFNAIAMANTPYWQQLWNNYPHTLLTGSGLAVGLPEGQMGNSEVGHMTIGSGRAIYQDLTKINLAIADGSFFTNPTLTKAMTKATPANAIHILGLLSPGGIHAHEQHLHALIKLAAQNNSPNLYIHAFLDGRDTPPKSAKSSLTRLEAICNNYKVGKIASIIGRYYAMDRDHNYARTQIAYELLTMGKAAYTAIDPQTAVEQAYARGETDEFISPTKIINADRNTNIQDGDIVIFINFRADRAKQLSYSLSKKHFTGFKRKLIPKLTEFVTFTEYSNELTAKIAFPKIKPINTLGECLAKQHLTQLRLAETEKYAHVTYFFNGGEELTFNQEKRILIPSPAVTTYDLAPAMSAQEITKTLIAAIYSKQYQVIICNLANADMVGHTGNLPATIKAINTIDLCLAEIIPAMLAVAGEVIISSDHGNAEFMYDPLTKQPHTAHTNALLPFIYVGNRQVTITKQLGTLADIAPSLLTLLDLTIPAEMTGQSLLTVK